MPKATTTIATKSPRYGERIAEIALTHAATEPSGRWLVLIGDSGEGSDPDDVLRFLDEMWPDIEADTPH